MANLWHAWGRSLVGVQAEVATSSIAVGHHRCATSRGYPSFLEPLQEPGRAPSADSTLAGAADTLSTYPPPYGA